MQTYEIRTNKTTTEDDIITIASGDNTTSIDSNGDNLKMDYTTIKKYISSARLLSYEEVCNNDTQRALKLYQVNLRLSAAFYPLLSLFEIVLRNALNEELITHFNDPEWLKNQRSGFMSDPSLNYINNQGRQASNDYLKKSVQKIINNNRGGTTQGLIISDLTFGFWTELFEKTHFQILQGRPLQIFRYLPSGMNRNQINKKLNGIRQFRNRISHHEAIIFDKDRNGQRIFSLSEAKTIYRDIQDLFSWLSLDFNAWTGKIDNVAFEIERANQVYKRYPRIRYFFIRIILGLKLYQKRYFKRK